MQWMTALIDKGNWEEVVEGYHTHRETEFSIDSCIPSKYINQGKILGSSIH